MAFAAPAALADGFQQSVFLARSPGFVLVTTEIGSEPCAFASGRFLDDAKVALNAGNVKFIEFDKLGVGRPKWPTLSITAHAAMVADGCVWTLEVVVRADPDGATVLGEPYQRAVSIWNANSFGASPGDDLTDYVAQIAGTYVQELIEDLRAARERLAE